MASIQTTNRLAWAIGGAVWLGLCWSMLVGAKVPGFRDSGYLYYPLFQWMDSEMQSGEFPLWNPYCNFGMSTIGDNTSSMLYPGKAVFLLRFLEFPARYGIYISLHILWAGIGAYFLARTCRAGVTGAVVTAMSYAAGGSVLTQCSNVIFLVSAAWLPFALAAVWQMIRTGDFRWAIFAGMACAMMILGGDPQMVYHLGLIAAASMILRVVKDRIRRRTSTHTNLEIKRSRQNWRRPIGLALFIATTSLLAAVQIIPTYQWSKLSERTDAGVSLYQALSHSLDLTTSLPAEKSGENPAYDRNRWAGWRTLIELPAPNSKAGNVYSFSLPPWSLLELFIPNASGKFMPTHQRWADGMVSPQGSPDRVWYPSIYLGGLTIWLALGGLKFRGRSASAWLSRIMLFFLLGSFGWYGLTWLLPIPSCGTQVGGVYWWLSTFLPGYSSFRYPAKLFVIVSLCLSVLAGLRFDERILDRISLLRSGLGWAMIGLIGLGFIVVLCGQAASFFERVPADALFGPFDRSGAQRGLILSLLHALLVVLTVVIILQLRTKQNSVGWLSRSSPLGVASRSTWLLVLITAIDLAIANHWILSLIPANAFTSATKLSAKLESLQTSPTDRNTVPITIYRERDAFLPEIWQQVSSNQRLEEILAWQRETLYPKHHFENRVRLIGSFSSIQPRLYEDWFAELENNPAAAVARDSNSADEQNGVQDDLIRSLSDGQLTLKSNGPDWQTNIQMWRPEGSLIFFVKEVGESVPLSPIRNTRTAVSSQDADTASSKLTFDQFAEVESEMTRFSCNSIELTVTNGEPCYLVHSCLHDGNWQATIRSAGAASTQSFPLIEFAPGYQGLRLQPGQHQIEIQYRLESFITAACISGGSWLLIPSCFLFSGFRQRANRKAWVR